MDPCGRNREKWLPKSAASRRSSHQAYHSTLWRSTVAPPQVVAASSSRETMKQLKAEMPGLEVCWIVLFKRNWRTRRWSPATDALIDAVKKSGLDGVDLDARCPVSAAFVKKLKA